MAKIEGCPDERKNLEEADLSPLSGGDIKWCDHLAKQYGRFLKNGTYPDHGTQSFYSLIFAQEKKKSVFVQTCTQMFTAALFIMVSKWKQT